MRKRRTRIIITRILETAVLLMGVSLLLLQTPKVQTDLALNAARYAEKYLDAKITFSSIKFSPFSTVIVKDLAVIDTRPACQLDTVLSAKHLSATFSLRGLLAKKGGVHLDRVRGRGVNLTLVIFDPREDGRRNNFESVFRSEPPDGELHEIPDLFTIRRADIQDFRYRMVNLTSNENHWRGHGINWFDLDVTVDARGHDINFVDSRCSFHIDWARAHEKSGYSFTISGDCITGMGLTEVTDTRIVDQWSKVDLKRYTMGYERNTDFADFLYRIKLEGEATAYPLSLKTISYFCGIFKDSPILLDVNDLKVDGPLADFNIESADFHDRYSGVRADLSGWMYDVFRPENSSFRADLRKFEFNSSSISKFISGFMSGKELDFSGYAKGMSANLTGRLEGPLNDLNADLRLATDDGDITLEGNLKDLVSKGTPTSYTASASLDNLDIGKAGLGSLFGRTSLKLTSHGSLDAKSPDLSIDNLQISKFTFDSYAYKEINGSGFFKDNTFTGNVRCNDQNLIFILGGSFSLSHISDNSIYKFNLNLPYADLAAMNIDKRPGTSKLSTSININLRSTGDRTLIGDAAISRLTYTDDEGRHNIGDILFASIMDQGRIRINLRSAFADLSYTGDPNFGNLANSILSLTAAQSLPAVFWTPLPVWNGRSFEASATIKDTREALKFLRQDIYISPDTNFSIGINDDAEFRASLDSDGIRYNGSVLKGLDFNADTERGETTATLAIDRLSHNNLSAESVGMQFEANGNSLHTILDIKNIAGKKIDTHIDASAILEREEGGKLRVKATMGESGINMSGTIWEFSRPLITASKEEIRFTDFTLHNGEQSIDLSGAYSEITPSLLSLDIVDFDLASVNALMGAEMSLKGILDGHIEFSSPSRTNAGLLIDLECPEFCLGRANAGRLQLKGHLDDEDDLFKFSLSGSEIRGRDYIRAEGSYNSISNYISAKLSFNDFNPGVFQPAVSGIFSEMDGHINGHITANGPVNSPAIRCNDFTLSDTRLTLIPTGVCYTLNGKLRYDGDGPLIEKLELADMKDGRAVISGRINDLDMHMQRFTILDRHTGASPVYGTLALGGDIRMRGNDATNLLIDADIANAGQGKVSISLADKNMSSGSILTFKEPAPQEEDGELEYQIPIRKNDSGIKLEAKARVNVNPGLEITATLDKEGANALNIAGEGVITADFNSTTGNLTLGGGYNITEGKYHFSTLGSLIAKDFAINDGSSLTFAGDALDTELNIDATHTLKTSLGALISDTTSVSTRRTVNCGIHIADKAKNPSLSFSIDVPDLDPTTKSLVDSELNTEDKVNRQFLSLVVLGGFMPGAQSGIMNSNSSSNFILSNLSSIMTGQLNTVLQKFDIPLDFGLSYQQNDVGNNVVDVAVSTQLFDNMVSVNGSVGNRKFSSTSDENMVGDLDISIKMNRSGHFKLNLFSHSADDYTNYLDNTQRNGVGVSYQKEYDSFKSLFREIFRKEDKEKEAVRNKRLIIEND